jgi:hypothetical protein
MAIIAGKSHMQEELTHWAERLLQGLTGEDIRPTSRGTRSGAPLRAIAQAAGSALRCIQNWCWRPFPSIAGAMSKRIRSCRPRGDIAMAPLNRSASYTTAPWSLVAKTLRGRFPLAMRPNTPSRPFWPPLPLPPASRLQSLASQSSGLSAVHWRRHPLKAQLRQVGSVLYFKAYSPLMRVIYPGWGEV